PLPADLIQQAVFSRDVFPGGKDDGPKSRKAVDIVGPAVEIARVGNDDQERVRRVQSKCRRGERSGRGAGTVDGGAASILKGGNDRMKALRLLDEACEVFQAFNARRNSGG